MDLVVQGEKKNLLVQAASLGSDSVVRVEEQLVEMESSWEGGRVVSDLPSLFTEEELVVYMELKFV